jgi:SPP1 family phage portal protein
MDNLLHGRRKIVTSCLPAQMQQPGFVGPTLNRDTLPTELNNALMVHEKNCAEEHQLLDIYKNRQKIFRRSGEDRLVNNMVGIPYPNAFTRQIVGYTYPEGIQLVQNRMEYLKDVETVNRYLRSENKAALDKVMADEQSIFGTHYRAVLPDTVQFDESPLEIYAMDIFNTFVAYSAYNGNRQVYAWNCFKVKKPDGEERYIHQIYTAYEKFTYNSSSSRSVQPTDFVSEQPHILGDIPIIEYPNNEFRLGDWELAVSLFDAINDIASDSVNDVEQTVRSYLALFGVDPDKTDIKEAKKNQILVFNGQPGVNQDAKFITAQIDGNSAALLRSYFEDAVRMVVGIPDRNSSGGGDTGEAINAKNGWREIDTVAKNKTMYTEMAERRFLKIVLNILSPKYISSKLTPLDIDIKIPRNKDENLQTKVQAGSIMDEMGFDEHDTVEHMDITGDIEGLATRWIAAKKRRKEEAVNQPWNTPTGADKDDSAQNSGNNPQSNNQPLDKATNQ